MKDVMISLWISLMIHGFVFSALTFVHHDGKKKTPVQPVFLDVSLDLGNRLAGGRKGEPIPPPGKKERPGDGLKGHGEKVKGPLSCVPPFQVENGIADTENIRIQDGDSGADSRDPDSGHGFTDHGRAWEEQAGFLSATGSDDSSGHEIKTSQKASPIYRVNPPPFYPRTARALGLEGTVELNVLVDAGGRVRDLKLFKSSGHKMLDRAAMESVKNWLFEPGKKGSHPVDMWVVVPMVFKLAQA